MAPPGKSPQPNLNGVVHGAVLGAPDDAGPPPGLIHRPAYFLEQELAVLQSVRPGGRVSLPTPLLDKAVGLIASRLPASESELSKRFQTAKLAKRPIDLAQIERATRFRDGALPFAVLRRDGFVMAVPRHQLALATTIYGIAVRAVVNWGMGLMPRIAFQADLEDLPFVTSIVSARDNFHWLDRTLGWFWFANEKSILVRAIDKVLGVVSPVSLNDLAQALFRRWAADNVPSRRALQEMCSQVPRFQVVRSMVSFAARDDVPSPLTQSDHTVVELFRRFGPRIEGHRLHEICATLGLVSGTIGRYLRSSPFVVEPQPGVFRLVGA